MFYIILGVIHLVFILIMIAILTLGERKLMAIVQRRIGPNVNGYHGLLQPFADGLKLFIKEMIIPYKASKRIFLLSPILFLSLSLLLWALIPIDFGVVFSDLRYGLLVLFMLSSLSVYGIIFSGWSSNSKYPFFGSLRSAAQMLSYEVALGFIFILLAMVANSFNITDIVEYQKNLWLVVPLLPIFLIFFISALAETNRAPFDLPESESELVAGYNVEYSSIIFAMFFLGEYSNLLIMSFLLTLFFWGGWVGLFFSLINVVIKVSVILIIFVLIRAVLPRYRYDHLMSIGWTTFLPFTLVYLLFVVMLLYSTNAFGVA